MFVCQDGKVNPCDYDYKSELSKWNVKNNSISEIWNSKEYNKYRCMHLDNVRKSLYLVIDVLLEMLANSVGIIGYRNHSQKLLNIICRNPNIKKIYVYCYKKSFTKIKERG